MKIQLRSTKSGMKSGSLKRLAVALTKKLGYKVFRTTNVRPQRKQFLYGDAVNKLEQYKFFKAKGLSALEFTTKPADVQDWLKAGKTVFGRKLLNASCGDGIVVIEPGVAPGAFDQACPVYTKYKPKKREFRVHVFKGKVVAIVEKRKRIDWGGPANPKIRNLANGYVFCQDVELTDALKKRINELALAAGEVCKSDFKGVDLGYNEKNDDLFVIEVNSAPGIEGTNVDRYVEAICSYA